MRPVFSVKHAEIYYQHVTSSDHAELTERFLNELIAFVVTHNNYYKKLLGKKKQPRLQDFRILTKAIISKHFDDLKSHGVQEKKFLNSSGGSTGIPQTFLQDMEFSSWSQATQTYYYRQMLHTDYANVPKVILWGSERDTFKQSDLKGKVTNWLTNTTFLNTFNQTEDGWLRYIDEINRAKPYFIKGYAGSLHQIAKVAKEHNHKLWRPKFLYSSAEMLRDFMREDIEGVFGAKVHDFYGSREVGAISGECEKGRKHIFTFNNFVEIVDMDNNPVEPGRVGKILITTLHNYSMPLIRYEIGDTGAISNEPCDCGVNLPWFSELKGRITDHFTTRTGTLVHGEYFTHLFYYRPWIKEFQVTQEDYEVIRVAIIKQGTVNKNDIEDITEKIKYIMGESCVIRWDYVSSIPKTPQGKHLFTRSLVK